MNLILDPHVHLYPCFSKDFFKILHTNLTKLSENIPDPALGTILTERKDCNYYQLLADSNQNELSKYEILNIEKFTTYLKLHLKKGSLLIYPGIQLNTLEKIEVLGLFTGIQNESPLPLNEAVDFILSNGGLPVINWAPGKWTGKRAELIKEYLVRDSRSRECLLGISKLLPENFSLPDLCKEEGSDLPLILGSDPLPFKGEESQAGTVGLVFKDLLYPETAELKKRITNKEYHFIGRRNGVLNSFFRVLKNEIARRL